MSSFREKKRKEAWVCTLLMSHESLNESHFDWSLDQRNKGLKNFSWHHLKIRPKWRSKRRKRKRKKEIFNEKFSWYFFYSLIKVMTRMKIGNREQDFRRFDVKWILQKSFNFLKALGKFASVLRRFAALFTVIHDSHVHRSFSDRMKINDLKMATPIEEKIDQNLKVSWLVVGCELRFELMNVILYFFVYLGCFPTGSYWNGDDKWWKK